MRCSSDRPRYIEFHSDGHVNDRLQSIVVLPSFTEFSLFVCRFSSRGRRDRSAGGVGGSGGRIGRAISGCHRDAGAGRERVDGPRAGGAGGARRHHLVQPAHVSDADVVPESQRLAAAHPNVGQRPVNAQSLPPASFCLFFCFFSLIYCLRFVLRTRQSSNVGLTDV